MIKVPYHQLATKHGIATEALTYLDIQWIIIVGLMEPQLKKPLLMVDHQVHHGQVPVEL